MLRFRSDVYAWFPDGRVERLSPGDGIYYQASVNPQGTHAVYFGGSSGAARIWRTDLLSGETVPLTPPEHAARHPAYSWDGARIAFASDSASSKPPEDLATLGPGGGPPLDHVVHIHSIDADGGDARQITSGEFQDQRPTFSPGGESIVFVSNRATGFERRRGLPRASLWSVPSNAERPPQPLSWRGLAYRPWFAADGASVFYFGKRRRFGLMRLGRPRIFRAPLAGGRPQSLSNDDVGVSHGPFADPDGRSILVHSTRDGGKWRIWELPLDGGPARLLEPPGFESALHPTRSRNGILVFDAPNL